MAPELIHGTSRSSDGKITSFKTVPLPDPKLVEDLEEYKVEQFSGDVDRGWLMPLIMNWGPMILLIGFWLWMMKGMQSGGKQVMSFGRSKAKLQSTKKTKITFPGRCGLRRSKGRTPGDYRVPQRPGQIPETRRKDTQRRAAVRRSRYG